MNFLLAQERKHILNVYLLKKMEADYKPTKNFIQMMSDNDFYEILQELVEFGIHRFERNYKDTYEPD